MGRAHASRHPPLHWTTLAPAVPAAAVLLCVSALIARGADLGYLTAILQDGAAPMVRSAIASLSATLLVSGVGIWLATTMVTPWLKENRAVHFASSLALPAAATWLLLGTASFAFIWRTPFAEWIFTLPGLQHRSDLTVIVSTTFAHFVRYAPILVWLLWSTTVAISSNQRSYAREIGSASADIVRAHLLAIWLPLVLVIAAFAHQDAFNDYLISYLTLRPSEATHTELLSHFLGREFRTLAIATSAERATAAVVGAAAIGAIASAFVFAVSTAIILWATRLLRLDARQWRPPAAAISSASGLMAWLPIGVASVMAAMLCVRLSQLQQVDFTAAFAIAPTLAASALVAGICWLLASAITYSAREAALHSDRSLPTQLGRLAAVAIALGFIPTIGLSLAVYTIAFAVLPPGEGTSYAAWVSAQVFRMFPLVAVLLIPLVHSIQDERIAYTRAAGAHYFQRLGENYLRPFAITHFAVFLIATNFVLNEGVVGSVFQAHIASVPELMLRATSGRSAAYPTAAAITLTEAVLFGSLLLLWGSQVYRQWRPQR